MRTPHEYRRKLPHIQPEDAVYFVTFNLRGAIPEHIMTKLNESYTAQKRNLLNSPKVNKKTEEDYYNQINDILDAGQYGKQWLKEPAVAQIVADSFHFLDERDFRLICYCIMSNHVHFVAYKLSRRLYKIMNSLKSYTANECNKVLNRSGAFWQREYFDRIVRDRNDLARKISYVINNPVKAGLVDIWEDYPFTYCHPSFLGSHSRV